MAYIEDPNAVYTINGIGQEEHDAPVTPNLIGAWSANAALKASEGLTNAFEALDGFDLKVENVEANNYIAQTETTSALSTAASLKSTAQTNTTNLQNLTPNVLSVSTAASSLFSNTQALSTSISTGVSTTQGKIPALQTAYANNNSNISINDGLISSVSSTISTSAGTITQLQTSATNLDSSLSTAIVDESGKVKKSGDTINGNLSVTSTGIKGPTPSSFSFAVGKSVGTDSSNNGVDILTFTSAASVNGNLINSTKAKNDQKFVAQRDIGNGLTVQSGQVVLNLGATFRVDDSLIKKTDQISVYNTDALYSQKGKRTPVTRYVMGSVTYYLDLNEFELPKKDDDNFVDTVTFDFIVTPQGSNYGLSIYSSVGVKGFLAPDSVVNNYTLTLGDSSKTYSYNVDCYYDAVNDVWFVGALKYKQALG
jgi:hypothetical protein